MQRCRFALLGLLALIMMTGCGGKVGTAPSFETGSERVKVAVSFFPLYEFTRYVGGENVNLVLMVPSGTEPHDWKPTAGHIRTLNEATLFMYNGAGMEPWVEKTIRSLDNKALITVEASHGFDLLAGNDDDHGGQDGQAAADAEHIDDDHDESDAGEWDPHLWLDPYGAIHLVEAVRDALIEIDPRNRTTYVANAASYIGKLKALDFEFTTGLQGCIRDEFFVSHAAFSYLAHRYGLEQHAMMGLSPEAEPRPQQLRQIVDEARKHEVKYIFFETLASDRVAKMVAAEIGASTLVLNPFEGLTESQVQAGEDYLSVQRENLENLRKALECDK